MDGQFFRAMIEEIYAAFGRQCPSQDSAGYRSLWRRCCEEHRIPNGAAKAIAYALTEYDSMPMNLGKAIIKEFQNWLSNNPQARATIQCCPECSSDTPGLFWVWDENGHRKLCRCACNQDERFAHWRPMTRRQAAEAGYLFEDPLFSGAPRKWLAPDVRAAIGHVERDNPLRRDNAENW